MTMEKIGQDQMLSQFKERYSGLIKENQELAGKIKQNEVQALKLQGAIAVSYTHLTLPTKA